MEASAAGVTSGGALAAEQVMGGELQPEPQVGVPHEKNQYVKIC